MQERIQKIIASAGIASRRKAEEMIEDGRVTVNGERAALGMKADPYRDHIKIDGKLLSRSGRLVYLVFHKPAGVLTSLSDPEGRPTIKDFIGKVKERVYPVGRLDYNSEGLILLTNDGKIADAIMHPSKKVAKRYRVKVKGIPEDEILRRFRKGIKLDDGYTIPAGIRRFGLTPKEKNTWLDVILYEGRNRQIRRMFEQVGHPVMKLKRIAINGISIGQLKQGEYRYLAREEVARLKKEVGLT